MMKGRAEFSTAEMVAIRDLLREKVQSDPQHQKTVRRKLRALGFYISDFVQSGCTVADFDELLAAGRIRVRGPARADKLHRPSPRPGRSGRSRRDEEYVVDLCDRILSRDASRQHRFPFLIGDGGQRLPVDAYYADLSLVVEYHERQHWEAVPFFDLRRTVSGLTRGEQRRRYDERRKEVLPQHGIALVVVRSQDLARDRADRLLRDEEYDLAVLRRLLSRFVDAV